MPANEMALLLLALKDERKRSRELERELRRKDAALAETAALLALRKKAHAIWGEAWPWSPNGWGAIATP